MNLIVKNNLRKNGSLYEDTIRVYTMKKIYISDENRNLIYNKYVYDEDERRAPKRYKVRFFRIFFIISIIAFIVGMFRIGKVCFVIIENVASYALVDVLQFIGIIAFQVVIALCGYSIYFFLSKGYEDKGNTEGREQIIDELVEDRLTEYIDSIKDDGTPIEREVSVSSEELREILGKREFR